MPKESDIQGIFDVVLAGGTQKIFFRDKSAYESTRANLSRKYKNYKKLISDLGGADPYEDKYFKCSWNGEEVYGIFKLEDVSKRAALPGKLYTVISL